jgi:hypothetical protein
LTLFLVFAVRLYSSLLLEAVQVAKKVEEVLLKDHDDQLRLTLMMDKPFLAGGRFGKWLYTACTLILVAITGTVGVYHLSEWLG